MSGPVILFKAKDPAALSAWSDGNAPAWDEFRAGADAIKAELGGRDLLRRRAGEEGVCMSGYIETDWKAEPLPGFRRERNSDHMLPALRSKAGKGWKARLATVRYIPVPKPGLPVIVMGGGYMGHFKIEQLGDEWFAWLGFNPYAGGDNPREMKEVDVDLWEEAKFSEYYVAKESAPTE